MKWYKHFLPLIPILLLLSQIGFYYLSNQEIKLTPLSPKNQIITDTINQLRLAKLNPIDLQSYYYRNEIEFFIVPDIVPIKIIFSTEKNVYSQVTALQKIIKKDNIREINFIDLSSKPAYATFQNL